MDEYINNLIDKLNPNIKKFIEELDLDFEIKDYSHKNGYEIKYNKLVIWHFDVDITDKELCEILLHNPQIDTLFLGKAVTDNNDGRQIRMIHYLLTASHNIIPIIMNIELEDESNYYVIDGMLIDRNQRSVIDYASGRKETLLHIPDGVTGFKEHCFTYNKFVCKLEIPTSLQFLEGIKSLPNLRFISLHGDETSPFVVKDDIIYEDKDGILTIAFIPPFHDSYKPVLRIKSLLKDLHHSICEEANRGRWENISAENFEYKEEYDRIDIKYYGGFYEQEWYIVYEELPTKICVSYTLWEHWKDECHVLFDEQNIGYHDCRNCPTWNDCQIICKSNTAYINKLWTTMKESVDKKYIVTDGDYSYISLDLTKHPSDIKKIVVAFLDIALRVKDICPIVDNHLQLLEFPDKDGGEVASRFPFDYRWYNDYPLGYVRPHDIMESEYDEDPPF